MRVLAEFRDAISRNDLDKIISLVNYSKENVKLILKNDCKTREIVASDSLTKDVLYFLATVR